MVIHMKFTFRKETKKLNSNWTCWN